MNYLKTALITALATGFMMSAYAATPTDSAVVTVGNPNQLTSATAPETVSSMEERAIEHKAFTVLDKSYGDANTFARYGVMYWDTVLHIGIKDKDQLKEVQTNLATALKTDSAIALIVVGETKYSQNDYFELQNEAINYFIALEGPDKVVSAVVDAPKNRLILTVTEASAKTAYAFLDKFGDTVVINVK